MDMKIIHKHQIQLEGETTELNLPKQSQIRTAEYLVGKRALFIWVEVPADIQATTEPRRFRVFKTGDGIPAGDQYVATAIDQHLPEAYHIYEIPLTAAAD